MEAAAGALPCDEVLRCGQEHLDAGVAVRPRFARDDVGQLYRDAGGSFAVWNATAGAPSTVAPGRGAYPESDIALLGAYEVGGVTCKTALTRVKEEAAKWPASAEVVGLAEREELIAPAAYNHLVLQEPAVYKA